MSESRDNSIQPLAAVAAVGPAGAPSVAPSPSAPVRSGASQPSDLNRHTGSPGASPTPNAAELRAAIEKLNAHALPDGQSLQLAIDAGTRQMIVVVRDSQTGLVVRQIPSEDVLRLARALDSGHGLLDLSA